MKKVLVLFLVGIIFSLNLIAKENSLKESSFAEIQKQIKNKQASMIEFGSSTCYSCVVMGKKLYKIKKSYPKSNIFYLNVFNNQDIVKRYEVRMIPTQIFLDKNGKVIDKHVGLLKDDKLLSKLTQFNILK